VNIRINSQILAHELRAINRIIASKPTIPILSHVLLVAEGDTLTLSGTDLELGLITSCPAEVTVAGRVALPAAKLAQMIEQLPNAAVKISVEKDKVHLSSGAFISQLQALSADDFPQLAGVDGVAATLATKDLTSLITRTRYAIDESNSKYTLQGALLVLAPNAAAMVATDGKRLAVATMNRAAGPDVRVILPSKTLDALLSFTDRPELMCTLCENHLFFAVHQRLLISRMLEGKFPNYERIIPQTSNKKAVINRAALTAALRRVALVAEDNHATYFDFQPTTLDVSSNNVEIGAAYERVAMTYTGDPIKICCDWQCLIQFLDTATGVTVTLELTDPQTPMLLSDGPHTLGVIMLMRN
jgi:DNA polymerase-3 subunit beta